MLLHYSFLLRCVRSLYSVTRVTEYRLALFVVDYLNNSGALKFMLDYKNDKFRPINAF